MLDYNAYLGRFGAAFRTDAWRRKPLGDKARALPYMLYNSASYKLERLRSR